jgi:type IV pilus assembly protein PilW
MENQQHKYSAGFTLIEILIAMAISGMVMTGIYQAYTQQMRVNNTQNQVVDMQQSVRVAMFFMEKDIRIAGFNPTGSADVGIDVASANTITLSMDETGGESDGKDNDRDGLIDESPECDGIADATIIYVLSNDVLPGPPDGQNDALTDGTTTPCHLLRNGQRLASNIDALNFVYLGVDDTDSSCQENCRLNPTTAQERANIRAVQITVIARSGTVIPGLSVPFIDQTTYYNEFNPGDIVLPSQNDGFRRVRLITEVRTRNIGLL